MTAANTLTVLRARQTDVTVFFFPAVGVTVAVQSPENGHDVFRYSVAILSYEDAQCGVRFDHTQGEILARQRLAKNESNIARISQIPGALLQFASDIAQLTSGWEYTE